MSVDIKIKKSPGRPRIYEAGKWTSLQFRIPKELRTNLLESLEKRNEELPYRLSLNSLLLELVKKSLDK